MLLPILVFTPAQNGASEVFSMDLIERFNAVQTLGKSDVGSVSFPSSVIYIGSLVLISLIIALSTYMYAKKSVSFPSFN